MCQGSFICYRLSAFLFFLPFSVYKNGVGAKFGVGDADMNQPKKKFSFKKLKEDINIKNIISNIKEKRLENKKILRHGSYSIGVMAIVIAIVVVLNLVIQELPRASEKLISAVSRLYTIGDQTKELLDDLDKDVDLYYIAQDGTESTDIQRLLERYKERSEHIKVEQKDPAVYPTLYPAVYIRLC